MIGAGLLGASVGLAARRAGLDVLLSDESSDHVRTASGMGAGRPRTDADRPQLVVVAVPPDHLGDVIAAALRASDAVVTDVGSVKSGPLAAVADVPGVERYVGGHPMAGSERSGPLAASAALFDGRPWAVTPHETSDQEAVELVEALVRLCGARAGPPEPGGARPRGGPDLAHPAPARGPGRRPAGRSARRPPGPVRPGRPRRDRVAAGDPALYEQIV